MNGVSQKRCGAWTGVLLTLCAVGSAGPKLDLTPTLRSQTLQIDAPRGAQRLLSGTFLTHSQAFLRQLAAKGKQTCAQTEVLYWSGTDGLDVLQELTRTARIYNWNFKEQTRHPVDEMVLVFQSPGARSPDVVGAANWKNHQLSLGLCRTAGPLE